MGLMAWAGWDAVACSHGRCQNQKAPVFCAPGKSSCKGMKADAKAASSDVSCYGINKCKGAGKCGGADGSSCAGTNSCKGMGWLSMPKDSCLAIEGGSLTPKKG